MLRKLFLIAIMCLGLVACGGGGGSGVASGSQAELDQMVVPVAAPSSLLDMSGSSRSQPPSMGALEI
jgi:hypothetical protein